MAYTPNIEIWAGSGSFFPQTFTPFGFYDSDSDFQCDAEAVASWAAYRLGFPITDVELQEVNFYAAFEEAVNEYSAQLNTYQARDQMLNLSGFNTGSINLTQRYVPQTFKGIFKLANAYGTEVGAGGEQVHYTGSIQLIRNRQVYDLTTDSTVEKGSLNTDSFTIRKIFHQNRPSVLRIMDPSLGVGTAGVLEEFNWGGMGYAESYMLLPVYHDILRTQAVEFNDQIRKSGYSFQLTGNRLRIFPIPKQDVKLWFTYTLDLEGLPFDKNSDDGLGKISDISNIPYQNITYKYINQMGKQWIRKYTLAIVTEMLGYIRNKYSSIPIPDGEVTLNGSDMVTAGKEKQDALIEELKTILDSMGQQAQLERKSAVAENLNKQLKYFPLKIYVR
jgi:hypothetical protein